MSTFVARPSTPTEARGRFAILPFEPSHYAQLPVRAEQAQDLDVMREAAGAAAEHGPAFSAVEQDDDGKIVAVLACAGLVERGHDHAVAWAAFAEGLRAAQWSPIVRAIRGVIEDGGYARIEMSVRAGFAAGQRFAEALGFAPSWTMYARDFADAGGEN